MNVKEIVKQHLESIGADGLHNDADGGCSCRMDDLMPCQACDMPPSINRCEAAKKGPCDCETKCDLGYHMITIKDEAKHE